MATQSRIRTIVIHYSATWEDDTSITTDVIDRWHKDRGWKGIGYHFVIYQDGSVHPGRPITEVGAHVGGHNTGTIGICYVGGLRKGTDGKTGYDTRTPAQTEAMTKLIFDLLTGKHNTDKVIVDPTAPVVGHRDMPDAATQCPGFDAAAWWGTMRGQRRTERPAAPNAPVRTPGVTEDQPNRAPEAGAITIGVGAGSAAAAAGEWWIVGLIVIAAIAFLVWRWKRRS